MSQPAIVVEKLGKRYKIGRAQHAGATWRSSLRAAVGAHLDRARILAEHGRDDQSLWALRDATFTVHPGEVVGFIGHNGAGKSTLLKILSRVVTPTTGRAVINGRVGTLLEVGTGFHPELTGRENIYLSGTILGMRRAEIRRVVDDIIDFSGLERFLDTPVKRYSSGMYVRLAFAVAAHLNPEILLVDEVLAVGDLQFQHKCLGKMRDVATSGRTILFVSHNMNAIRTLCTRAILLDAGRFVADGPPDAIVDRYVQSSTAQLASGGQITWPANGPAPGGDELRLCAVRALGPAGNVQGLFQVNDPICIEIEYELRQRLRGIRIILQLATGDGTTAFASTDHSVQLPEHPPGRYRSTCRIPARLLNSGAYSIRLSADVPGVTRLLPAQHVLQVHLTGSGNQGSDYAEHWPGAVCPRLEWEVQPVTQPTPPAEPVPQRTAAPAARLPAALRHVLVVVVDALRPDHLSLHGYERDTTPFLRHLADSSAVFTRAVAAANWTYPAVASLLSGLYPHHHGGTYHDEPRDFDRGLMPQPVRTDVTLLPETLATRGFETLFVSAVAFAELAVTGRFGTSWAQDFAPADAVVQRYLRWIKRRRRDRTFAYLHLGDTHEPLQLPEPQRSVFGPIADLPDIGCWGPYCATAPADADFARFRANRVRFYDAAVRYVDAQLERVFAHLRSLALLDQTLVIFTADHGEEFWEHAALERQHFYDPRPWYGVSHGHHLFGEIINVPLLMHGPGVTARQHDQLVSSVDVAPTILDLLDVRPPAGAEPGDGRSLLAPLPHRTVLSEATAYGYEKQAVIQDDLKLYVSRGDGIQWAFDLATDPGETSPRAIDEIPTAFRSYLPDTAPPADPSRRFDKQLTTRLRALGYVE